MEDEITKHTRKIVSAARTPGHSFAARMKEIFIEVAIIVFAVSLSIWFHNRSEHQREQTEVRDFLTDVTADLSADIAAMETERQNQQRVVAKYSRLLQISGARADSVDASPTPLTLVLNPALRTTNDGIYEGFKSGGKIGLIEDKQVKQLLLTYYQQKMKALEKSESYYNAAIGRLTRFTGYMNFHTMSADREWRPTLDFVIQTADIDIHNYSDAIHMANNIIAAITQHP